MWFILTEPGKEGRWDESEFFETGRREIADALSLLRDRLAIIPRFGTALDFGCGLGRLSQALAERFEHVLGVDISSTMIEAARSRNRHGERVIYHVNRSDRLPMLGGETIDFIYSRITLQHIPRAAMKSYLAEFARVLAPGGVAMFQVMTRARPLSVRIRHRIRDLAPDMYRWARDVVFREARFEMNTLSERDVRAAIETSTVRVVALLDDGISDPVFDSRWVVAQRDQR